jgi:hypothetical protein
VSLFYSLRSGDYAIVDAGGTEMYTIYTQTRENSGTIFSIVILAAYFGAMYFVAFVL